MHLKLSTAVLNWNCSTTKVKHRLFQFDQKSAMKAGTLDSCEWLLTHTTYVPPTGTPCESVLG